jgi:hypothetical protein
MLRAGSPTSGRASFFYGKHRTVVPAVLTFPASYTARCQLAKCMVRRQTARGLKMFERIVRVNVSGLFVENCSPGT